MLRILILFLCMYISTFSIVNFESLKWNDKVFDIILSYPSIQKQESFSEGIEIYKLDNPVPNVANYKFYLESGRLYRIDVTFDNEKVDRNQVRKIYDTLVKDMGEPVAKDKIDEKLINTSLRGNSVTFSPDDKTVIYFKGIDTLDKKGNMIKSNLIVEYRDLRALNIMP